MKQYRITSTNFVPPGDTGDADAVMDPHELDTLKRLAGMPVFEEVGKGAGLVGDNPSMVPQAQETGIVRPMGSNPSYTASYRNELLAKYQADPGSYLWFMINFEPVRGLGANAGTLEEKIKKYLEDNPKHRPENKPQAPGSID